MISSESHFPRHNGNYKIRDALSTSARALIVPKKPLFLFTIYAIV